MTKKLLIGKFNGLFGIRGEVKVFSYSKPCTNILSYKPWFIKLQNTWRPLEFTKGFVSSKNIVVRIMDVCNIDQAQQLLGLNIYIKRSQLAILEKDQYYWADIIGFKVINKQNIYLGNVSSILDTGANDVLIVDGKKTHFVPYIKHFLIKVDLDKKQVLVDWDEDF